MILKYYYFWSVKLSIGFVCKFVSTNWCEHLFCPIKYGYISWDIYTLNNLNFSPNTERNLLGIDTKNYIVKEQ
jgi:hypothetical protein